MESLRSWSTANGPGGSRYLSTPISRAALSTLRPPAPSSCLSTAPGVVMGRSWRQRSQINWEFAPSHLLLNLRESGECNAGDELPSLGLSSAPHSGCDDDLTYW